MLTPSIHFYDKGINDETKKQSILFFLNYLRPHKKMFVQIVMGMLLGLVFQLIFPFLTQSMIDVGVLNNNLNFIILILVTQLILSTSQLSVGFIQSWIFTHINTRINVALISDFIFKLLKLPIRFFDSKKTGDICSALEIIRVLKVFSQVPHLQLSFHYSILLCLALYLLFTICKFLSSL